MADGARDQISVARATQSLYLNVDHAVLLETVVPLMTSTHGASWMMSAAAAGRRIHWYRWVAGSAVAEPSVAEAKDMSDAMAAPRSWWEPQRMAGCQPSSCQAWALCVAGRTRTKRRTCWSLRNAARSQLAVRHPRHSGRLNPKAVYFRASSVATAVTHGGAMLWNLSKEAATRWSGGFWAVA